MTREVRRRPNLTIYAATRAERLLFDGRHVTGVRVLGAANERDMHAARDHRLAGALHSPALLMRSGIGPAEELAALGIAVVADRRASASI